MGRWLSKDVTALPLATIDAEISSLEKKPLLERSVLDIERLADLRDAKKRIIGGCRDH